MAHLPLTSESVGFASVSARFDGINNSGKLPGKPGAGRPKGSVNQFTADVKSMILGALHDAGGRNYLHKQAIANPTAFMGLVGKVLPTTLVGDPKRPIHISVTEEERRREVDAVLDAVFGVSLTPDVSLTPKEPLGLTIEHEAETVSANLEPQAVDNAEPDDNVVPLSHIKSHL